MLLFRRRKKTLIEREREYRERVKNGHACYFGEIEDKIDKS